MDKEIVHIYRIYFPTSNKCYIGQTSRLKKRMFAHLRDVRTNSMVHRALIKYEDWCVSVLHTCQSRDEANKVEIEEIRNFNSVAPNGYNINSGGDGNSGWTPSDETKRKIGNAHRGKTVSDAAKKKLSASHLGKKHTDETKAKISASKIGLTGDKNAFYGRHHTDETKAAMSAANSGKNHYFYGKHCTDETKSKMRVTCLKTALKKRTKQFAELKELACEQGIDISTILQEQQGTQQ